MSLCCLNVWCFVCSVADDVVALRPCACGIISPGTYSVAGGGMIGRKADVAIVGAGILGLAHAYLAAKAGKSVVVFEKSPRAMGASVRNFGMVWPVGQPAGEMLQIALRSRQLWLEVLRAAKLPCRETGSLHVTYREDEARVAREFAELGPELGYDCRCLGADKVLEKSQAVKPHGLLGGLWSATEFTVDPRQVL